MNKIWPLIFLIIVLISCGGKINYSLEKDSAVISVFTNSEIKSLRYFLDFYDQVVVRSTGISDIPNAYYNYVLELNEIAVLSMDSIYYHIGLSNDIRHDFLVKLDNKMGVFDEIYEWDTPLMVRSKDTVLYNPDPKYFETLELKVDSKFIDLFEELGMRDTLLTDFAEIVRLAGDATPVHMTRLIGQPHLFDFKQDYVRLIYGVFLLLIEEPMEVRINRYLSS